MLQDKRLKAAEALVKELMERQAEHDAVLGTAGEGDVSAPPADLGELAKPKRQEVALRRCCPLMVRGLELFRCPHISVSIVPYLL